MRNVRFFTSFLSVKTNQNKTRTAPQKKPKADLDKNNSFAPGGPSKKFSALK
jgi:hypothetical protein